MKQGNRKAFTKVVSLLLIFTLITSIFAGSGVLAYEHNEDELANETQGETEESSAEGTNNTPTETNSDVSDAATTTDTSSQGVIGKAPAEFTIDLSVEGDTANYVIYDNGGTVGVLGDDSYTFTPQAVGNTYTITGGTAGTETARIIVPADVGTITTPLDITLENANLQNIETPFQLVATTDQTSGAVVNLHLNGINTVKSTATSSDIVGVLKIAAGIQVPAGTAITIDDGGDGEGIVTATGGNSGAGIGGGYGGAGGTITIEGEPDVIAQGGEGAAGIGGGDAAGSGGTVNINGGTVEAKGGAYGGAGIGGGDRGAGGNVTITGGTVKATGGGGGYNGAYTGGAGIGGGGEGAGGNVTISGTASVTAVGGSELYDGGGAGIGSGGRNQSGSNVSISNTANVTAVSDGIANPAINDVNDTNGSETPANVVNVTLGIPVSTTSDSIARTQVPVGADVSTDTALPANYKSFAVTTGIHTGNTPIEIYAEDGMTKLGDVVKQADNQNVTAGTSLAAVPVKLVSGQEADFTIDLSVEGDQAKYVNYDHGGTSGVVSDDSYTFTPQAVGNTYTITGGTAGTDTASIIVPADVGTITTPLDITLENANLQNIETPFKLIATTDQTSGAVVNLHVDGINTVKATAHNSLTLGMIGAAGIQVPKGTTITIDDGGDDEGEITVTGGYCGAGIGGYATYDGVYYSGYDSGTINVHGGTVNATGGQYGAGIGGGDGASGGTINISGTAPVTATGGQYGAGIGGGTNGHGGNITISGAADVTATGTNNGGAGIGGGYDGSGGTIIIGETANVTATGAQYGAGIGGGSDGDGGNITISGTADVTATGGTDGAGIGGGVTGAGGTINITGGTINATGGVNGAGIGGGNGATAVGGGDAGAGGTITIGGTANVTAKGGLTAAGIGGGYRGSGGDITITGGTVEAIGGSSPSYYGGAGIGAGGTLGAKLPAESANISISDTANVTAVSDGIKPALDDIDNTNGSETPANLVNATLDIALDSANPTVIKAYQDADANPSTPPSGSEIATVTLPSGYKSVAFTTGSYAGNTQLDAYDSTGTVFNNWIVKADGSNQNISAGAGVLVSVPVKLAN